MLFSNILTIIVLLQFHFHSHSSQACSPDGAYFNDLESECKNYLVCLNRKLVKMSNRIEIQP